MGWFDHRHHWTDVQLHPVKAPDAAQAQGYLLLQECRCGAVRQLEYSAGDAPVIRNAVVKTEAA
jgi:hypothetical protein